MCTYCTTNNYRAIYENHVGSIPQDISGRVYEIHHIDGNHNNNDPINLKAVTIQEHYDIHYINGDLGACSLIMSRMKKSPEEISAMVTKHNRQMVENRTHPFLKQADGSSVGLSTTLTNVKNGTHNFLRDNTPPAMRLYINGTHPFIGGEIQRKSNTARVNAKTHNFQRREDGTSFATDRVANGTHPLMGSAPNSKRLLNGTHPSQIKVSCINCRGVFDKANYGRSHGAKCDKPTVG